MKTIPTRKTPAATMAAIQRFFKGCIKLNTSLENDTLYKTMGVSVKLAEEKFSYYSKLWVSSSERPLMTTVSIGNFFLLFLHRCNSSFLKVLFCRIDSLRTIKRGGAITGGVRKKEETGQGAAVNRRS